jgi:uncharacterized membrane protein YraQ (UPF0718 family)
VNTKKINLLLIGELTSIALVLLAVVDFRRGFLFAQADYIAKNAYYVFSPLQLALIFFGIPGLIFFRKQLALPDSRLTNRLLVGVFILLLIDAGLYRGVAASRAIGAGKIGFDWLNAYGSEGWVKPLALSVSYILTVWHATVLSCLGAGLALIALPRLINRWQRHQGWKGALSGTLYSLTQPFCSCCVALTSPGLFRSRSSMTFAISVLLGAPLLKISTLILAGSFLPFPYALLRIAGGLLVTILLSYALTKWFLGEVVRKEGEVAEAATSAVSDVPSEVISTWLKLSAKIALVLIPSMMFGTLLASAVWSFWPQDFGNSAFSVIATSVIGSLVMVSTWSEIPLAAQMISKGMTGPAASMLVALPAVNLGSLLIIFKVSRDWRIPVGLGLGVIAISTVAGLAFL